MFYLITFLIIANLHCFGGCPFRANETAPSSEKSSNLKDCPACTNQTSYLTLPLPEDSLPYRVTIEQADFMLPTGLHSFAYAVYEGQWVLIGGRTNGLHDVDNTDPTSNPFPSSQQNMNVFVINPKTKETYSRALNDPSGKLSQVQIDLLSATNTLFCYANKKNTLYVVGGYGIDTATNKMETKQALTAIDIPHLIKWVKNPETSKSASKCVRTIFHPIFQLTGGVMLQSNENQPYLLAFGQNFSGNYVTTSNGSYSRQVRPIQIIDDGHALSVQLYPQPEPLPHYRRRDLNVIPVIKRNGESLAMSFSALSGVFTLSDNIDNPGAWTIPIEIDPDGCSRMLDPNNPNTFAQAMNNYSCANMGLYSLKKDRMYTLLFGGISASMFSDGSSCNTNPNPQCNCCTAWLPSKGNIFTTCCNLPFSNDVTTVEIDSQGVYRQYLMSGTYPTINSFPPIVPSFTPKTCSGDPLQTIYYFGANAAFIPTEELPTFPNGVVSLDQLGENPVFVGYILGGIASTILDTNSTTDSQSSPYIFKVTISPQ